MDVGTDHKLIEFPRERRTGRNEAELEAVIQRLQQLDRAGLAGTLLRLRPHELGALQARLTSGGQRQLHLHVAARLRHCLRRRDLVARTGPLDWLVVLPGVTGPQRLAGVGQRIQQACAGHYTLGEQSVRLELGMGAVYFPYSGREPVALLERAARMLEEALQQRCWPWSVPGGRCARFTESGPNGCA